MFELRHLDEYLILPAVDGKDEVGLVVEVVELVVVGRDDDFGLVRGGATSDSET